MASEVKAMLSSVGYFLLILSVLGQILHVIATRLFGVDFPTFLLGLMFLGTALVVASPGYNPNFSRFISHGIERRSMSVLRRGSRRMSSELLMPDDDE